MFGRDLEVWEFSKVASDVKIFTTTIVGIGVSCNSYVCVGATEKTATEKNDLGGMGSNSRSSDFFCLPTSRPSNSTKVDPPRSVCSGLPLMWFLILHYQNCLIRGPIFDIVRLCGWNFRVGVPRTGVPRRYFVKTIDSIVWQSPNAYLENKSET